jgi:hypothetical protein
MKVVFEMINLGRMTFFFGMQIFKKKWDIPMSA